MIRRLNRLNEFTLIGKTALTFSLAILLCVTLASPAVAQDDILGDIKSDSAQQNTTNDSSADQSVADAATTVVDDEAADSSAGNDGSESTSSDAGDTENSDEEAGNTIDETTGTVSGSSWEKFKNAGALGLLLDGGLFMWPILIMGILAVGVIIERYRSLKMLNVDDDDVRAQVQQLLFEDNVSEALELCDQQAGPVPAVLSAGLRKYYVLRKLNYDAARTEEQVVKAMDDYSVHIVAGLERHLPVLATVSSAAPMLGFLGTVQGMIVAFQNIVDQMGETNIVEAAAAGIQVSLLTTCFGLIVGIPAFVGFNYFTSVINQFVLQVEQSATELIENVTIQLAAAGLEDEATEGSES
ncbi:MAG: MotA/TolQ/ExbB proton channel family protein [Planctomycetota bacterium]|nr:MotA/TolQ/ExbB proton channel family protein [Planctomycetota bacterium]